MDTFSHQAQANVIYTDFEKVFYKINHNLLLLKLIFFMNNLNLNID